MMIGLADKGSVSKQLILVNLLFPEGKPERLLDLFWDINASKYFCLCGVL